MRRFSSIERAHGPVGSASNSGVSLTPPSNRLVFEGEWVFFLSIRNRYFARIAARGVQETGSTRPTRKR